MDIVMFFQIMAAVFGGNVVFLMFSWGLWKMTALERQGITEDKLPWRVLAALGIPPAAFAAILYFIPT